MRPSRLTIYLAGVCAVGFVGMAWVLVGTSWPEIVGGLLIWPTLFLAAAAIVGEVKPIRLTLGRNETRRLSTSAPFVLALVAVSGVGVAVLVQSIASLSDDLLNRRELKKTLFNTAQYALSVITARAVFCLITGAPFLGGPMSVSPTQVGALLVGGIAMVAVNWVLVAAVVSIALSEPLGRVLRADGVQQALTHLVLLSIGGIAADIASDGFGVLILLAAPVAAAHLFAASAARHAYEAAHDGLTGLRNRGQADLELRQNLEAMSQSDFGGPGLVLLDLDHFKDVNDTLGHPVGDRILREVARRLTEAAPPDASVHRLGGDEFAAIVPHDLATSRQVAKDLLARLDAPMQVDSIELLVRASAGVAVAPLHGTDSETLMKNADIALYHAKLERDRISTYSPDYDVNTLERLQLLADLRAALNAGELHVHYQPQVDLTESRMVAVEALIRWRHPVHGMVGPDEFIPLAENSGLIFPVTDFVLDTALGQLAHWRASGFDLRMSVNLSARHLSDLALPEQVRSALARHGIPPSSLILEVTETGILSDAVRADAVIGALRRIGVEIAIDDYGTGNASLSYLRRLEIDELKVDRSFVSNISADHHDLIIVRSTIELALALGLRVVAEGIEDQATADALRGFGRVIGQGHYFSAAAPAEQITARLEAECSASSEPSQGQ